MSKVWNRVPGAAAELHGLAVELADQLELVLTQAQVRERFRNDPSSSVVVISADPWEWVFPAESTPSRLAAARLLDRWLGLGRRLLSAAAPETVADFDRQEGVLRSPVDLSSTARGPEAPHSQGAAERVRAALAAQVRLTEMVVGEHQAAGELWLVPDTNALLTNPALEEWEGEEPATIVIVPQVMREVDRHKLHHPNPNVQAKATQLVRRFEEYGRRGDTLEEAVPLSGTLRYRDVAVDADVRASLPWLRPDNPDDQILASVLELRWHNPNRPVTLVTEDRNLRNKARHARIPTDRAPKPSREADANRSSTRQRPIVKVKSVRVEQRWPPQRPRSLPPLYVLAIELVNVGERSAIDATGTASFHPSGDAARAPLGAFQMPALEPRGTWMLEYTLGLPPPTVVTATSASIEGICQDTDGNEYPLG
jgi:hypothetical protein